MSSNFQFVLPSKYSHLNFAGFRQNSQQSAPPSPPTVKTPRMNLGGSTQNSQQHVSSNPQSGRTARLNIGGSVKKSQQPVPSNPPSAETPLLNIGGSARNSQQHVSPTPRFVLLPEYSHLNLGGSAQNSQQHAYFNTPSDRSPGLNRRGSSQNSQQHISSTPQFILSPQYSYQNFGGFSQNQVPGATEIPAHNHVHEASNTRAFNLNEAPSERNDHAREDSGSDQNWK